MQTVEQRVSRRARGAADIKIARMAGAAQFTSAINRDVAKRILAGDYDNAFEVQAALEALRIARTAWNTRLEASLPPSAPVEALNGYRAAVSWIGADSWDGCSDCVAILKAARTADIEWDWAGDSDRIAAELAKIKPFVSAIPVSIGRHVPPSGIAEMVRPEVAAFALLMERQLRANDHKPGWKNDDPEKLCGRILDEQRELADALVFGERNGRAHELTFSGTASEPAYRAKMEQATDRVSREAADVANFAMMVADVCGSLDLSNKGVG